MGILYRSDISFFNIVFIPFILWGSPQIIIPAFLLLSFWFYQQKNFKAAYLCLASLIIATGLEFVLKNILWVPKPSTESFGSRFPFKWTVASYKTQSSLPSGHVLRTVLFILFLVHWIPAIRNRKALKVFLMFLPFITAFAAVYYGAHWTRDAVAGAWLAVLAFLVCDRYVAS